MEFYISQSEADNHAVREAACACIAELGTKINKECVRQYVTKLVDALSICFEDDSWPVRDGKPEFLAVENNNKVNQSLKIDMSKSRLHEASLGYDKGFFLQF